MYQYTIYILKFSILQFHFTFFKKLLPFSGVTLKKWGILHLHFTLFEAKLRFSGASPKKCKLLLWGYERCQEV